MTVQQSSKLRCFILLVSIASQTFAKLNIKRIKNHKDRYVQRKLRPEDLGAMHNTIMEKVHDRILENPTQDFDEFSSIMYEEVSVLCDDGDHVCKQNIMKSIGRARYEVKEHFAGFETYHIRSFLPRQLNDYVVYTYEKIYNSVQTLVEIGWELYESELEDILKITAETNTSDINKVAIRSLVSIAKGSGEFWIEIENNPDSVLNRKRRRRELQLFNSTILSNVPRPNVTNLSNIPLSNATIISNLQNTTIVSNIQNSTILSNIVSVSAVVTNNTAANIATDIKGGMLSSLPTLIIATILPSLGYFAFLTTFLSESIISSLTALGII